jgi:hypothetical protein
VVWVEAVVVWAEAAAVVWVAAAAVVWVAAADVRPEAKIQSS